MREQSKKRLQSGITGFVMLGILGISLLPLVLPASIVATLFTPVVLFPAIAVIGLLAFAAFAVTLYGFLKGKRTASDKISLGLMVFASIATLAVVGFSLAGYLTGSFGLFEIIAGAVGVAAGVVRFVGSGNKFALLGPLPEDKRVQSPRPIGTSIKSVQGGQQLEAEYNAIEKEISDLEKNIDKIERDIDEINKENTEINHEVENYKAYVHSLRESYKEENINDVNYKKDSDSSSGSVTSELSSGLKRPVGRDNDSTSDGDESDLTSSSNGGTSPKQQLTLLPPHTAAKLQSIGYFSALQNVTRGDAVLPRKI